MPDESSSSCGRREFFRRGLTTVGTVAFGTLTAEIFSACDNLLTGPDKDGDGGPDSVTIDISLPENQALASVGGTIALGANHVDSQGILVYRSGSSTVKAFSRQCTHQGCTVDPFAGGISNCPCHGSQFNLSGTPVVGPAQSPLDQYTATLSGNLITITS